MKRGRLAKRSEVRSVLPMALLTLIVLSTFTLLHYRATVHLLVAERQAEADAVAQRIARTFEGGAVPRDDQLYRLRSTAEAITVYENGRPLVGIGEIADPHRVMLGRALLPLAGRQAELEVALPAAELRQRNLLIGRLAPLLLAINAAMLVLVVLFSRRLFDPLDQLLRRVQEARGRSGEGEETEIDFLLATVEEALAALAAREAPAGAELETLQRTLERSLSLIGELSAGVAHEMRNSLATLRGYLTLVEQAADDEPKGEYIAELRRETDHLKRVLDDFLTFARPGSARMEEVELVPLVHRAAADPALDGFPVTVRYAADPDSLRAMGDVQLLERAFRNLLHNAAQAQRETAPGEPLRVLVRGEAERVEVIIDDRGPGLPEEIRARLFHPFATRRPGGVGLGLALTRRIVELHRGGLRLDDREDGGTRAILWLPCSVFGASATNGSKSSDPSECQEI